VSAFPAVIVRANAPLVRIHHNLRDPEYFSADSSGRFDPPVGSTAGFGTCYLSTHPLGAFLETFGRIRPVLQRHVDERVLTQVFLVSDTRIADMTNPSILGMYGLTAEIGIGGDEHTYEITQRWAEALFAAGFGGVRYAARHDPALHARSVAVFGKPGVQPTQVLAGPATHIPEELVERAADEYAIEVLPSVPISGAQYY
jgi:hypothetical protein